MAIIGTLFIAAATAMGVATTSPTEASWVDKVHGGSTFGTSDLTGISNFAHASSGYGTLRRPIAGTADLNSTMSYSHPGAPSRQMQMLENPGRDYFNILRASGTFNSCARSQPAGFLDGCAPLPKTEPRTYATSTLGNFQIAASGAPRVRIGTGAYPGGISNAPVARAECTPGQMGRASLTGVGSDLITAGPVLIGDADDFVELKIPAANTQNVVTQKLGSYHYKATLQRIEATEIGKSKVQLKLKVEADGLLTSWDMNVILVHAECGAAVPLVQPPKLPGIADWADLPMDTQMRSAVMRASEAPAALRPVIDAVEDRQSDESEATEGGDEDGPITTTQSAAAPTTSAPTDAEAAGPETASPETVAPETTERTAAAGGPQNPASVRVGREFTVVNRDGIELGTAKIDDIVRTPDCGIELTLTISTSAEAGPDRWATVEPSDFAEARPGGSVRKASHLSSECERAAKSRTTALSPGREYEIDIAFQLDDSAQRAMLRPDGTAGWVFDLPPLPRMSTTKTTSPQVTAPISGPSATTSPVAEDTAVATAEA
ncbi:MAG: hypothetical protein ACI39C_02835 [Dietzia sp.]